jgi:poly(A) polymerase
METMNLLALPDPAPTVARMAQLGVLAVILPEADPSALATLIAQEQAQGQAPDALRRLAAMLPPDPALAAQVSARFRFSGAQKKRLVAAARRGDQPDEPRALAYRLGRDEALDRLLIAGIDASSLNGWEIPLLPLKGGEVVARGVSVGPQVARILQAVENRWVEEGFPERDRVEAILTEELAR